MKLVLYNRLKKQQHKDMAFLQDMLMDMAYSLFPDIVLHGGTAIWRCYQGNRFSEDIDLYYYQVTGIETKLRKALLQIGLQISKLKTTGNALFAKITDGKQEVRLEILFLDKDDKIFKEKVIKQYERTDGSSMTVFCLSQESLIQEKALAYKNRRLVRDVYDIYFLLPFSDLSVSQKQLLGKAIESWQRPVDEKALLAIVFCGAVPSYEQMLAEIKRQLSFGWD